jgi:hypothetical protein
MSDAKTGALEDAIKGCIRDHGKYATMAMVYRLCGLGEPTHLVGLDMEPIIATLNVTEIADKLS